MRDRVKTAAVQSAEISEDQTIGLINLWDMSFVPLGTVTFVASDNARPSTNIWAVSIATTISRRGTANGPRRSNSDKEATRMKKKGWFFFTEPQIKQLKDTNVSLNRMNLTARRALRRVRWSNLTQNQYRQEGLAFGAIADRIVSVLKYRQQILRVAREKEPDVIRLKCAPPPTRGCDPSPRKSKDSRNKIPTRSGTSARIGQLGGILFQNGPASVVAHRTTQNSSGSDICRLLHQRLPPDVLVK